MKPKTKTYFTRKEMVPYLFLTPAAFFILAFLAYPLLTVFFYSLQSYDVTRIAEKGFIGFENFKKLLADKIFYRSLTVSAKWVLVEVASQLTLGMILALLLDKQFKGRGIYRCIVFFPWAVSGVLTSMLWSLIFNENIGLLNSIGKDLGVLTKSIAWLGNMKTVFMATAVAEIWRGIPFFAITILAALQNIPPDLHEACVMDGASAMQEIFLVKLPILKDTVILTTLLRAVWEFNNVDLIFTLTGGGPSYRTTTLTMYMTNMSVKNGNYGYGSTLAVMAFIILLIFAAIYLKISGYGKEEA
jgi:multiple sugar transport system permease protein